MTNSSYYFCLLMIYWLLEKIMKISTSLTMKWKRILLSKFKDQQKTIIGMSIHCDRNDTCCDYHKKNISRRYWSSFSWRGQIQLILYLLVTLFLAKIKFLPVKLKRRCTRCHLSQLLKGYCMKLYVFWTSHMPDAKYARCEVSLIAIEPPHV